MPNSTARGGPGPTAGAASSPAPSAAGFAAAVLPVTAQNVVQAPFDGLVAGETIPSGGFAMPAYRAMPAGKQRLPVVLVVSGSSACTSTSPTWRAASRSGYRDRAQLFVRQGDAQSYGEIARLVERSDLQVPDAQVMADLDACVAWAGANGGDVTRLGITGFCWGGRITWLYDAHNPAVKAGVAWYGRLVGAAARCSPGARWTSRRSCGPECSACTAVPTRASRSTRLIR